MLLRKKLVAAVAVGSLLSIAVATPPAQAAATQWGCSSGYVCVYERDPALWADPELSFYTYGYHVLSNQVGKHWVFNNQTGGAKAHLCKGTSGNCVLTINSDNMYEYDLTPINSIRLTAS